MIRVSAAGIGLVLGAIGILAIAYGGYQVAKKLGIAPDLGPPRPGTPRNPAGVPYCPGRLKLPGPRGSACCCPIWDPFCSGCWVRAAAGASIAGDFGV